MNNNDVDLHKEIEHLRRQVKELLALNRIAQAIASSLEVEAILHIIVDESTALTGAEQGSVFVVDDQSSGGMTTLVRGVPPKDHSLAHLVDSHLTGWIIHNKETLIVDDLTNDPRFPGFHGKEYPIKAALSVPLMTGEQVIGAINLSNRGEKKFSEDDARLVSHLSSQSAQVLENARVCQQLSRENLYLRKEVTKQYQFGEMIGKSRPMQNVFALLERIASSETSVIIQGESGTGKELVARAIHYNGPRKAGRFVALDCGAIPENLLESELFGYIKGAFTGAVKDKTGLFEEADGGTLFLDEIANMPLTIQGKLLRALQEREIRPVGATTTRKVDVRLVTASSTNLSTLVGEEKFREDLYYRLNVVGVDLPPLRERSGDIPVLSRHFLEKLAPKMNKRIKGFDPEAVTTLEKYNWPGNVRELENIIERALTLASPEQKLITTNLLPEHIRVSREGLPSIETSSLPDALELVKRRMISEALDRFDGNKTKAAEHLGISRIGLNKMLKKWEDG